MPHCILEHHSDQKFDTKTVLNDIVGIMVDSELFNISDIKARALPYDTAIVADGTGDNHFVHLTISILEGRPQDKLSALGRDMFAFLQGKFSNTDNVTVHISQMNKDNYFK